MPFLKPICFLLAAVGVSPVVLAAGPAQKVKPPVAQVWIDLATFSGNMPAMPTASAGGVFGSLLGASGQAGGAGARGNMFGNTQTGATGRWMDVVLTSRTNPRLMRAQQAVPPSAKFAAPLTLVAPEDVEPEPAVPESAPVAGGHEMPKGKMYLYWGCSSEVRKGQPLVLDMSKMDRAQMARFFQTRGATSALPAPARGRPVWPNKADDRMLAPGASVAGEHVFRGDGVPEGVLVNIGASHDVMPPIALERSDDGPAVRFRWQPMSQARAWFISSMGARSDGEAAARGEMEMVFWTSSELPDMGSGLVNYQPNAAIDKWLKEKVVLPATSTECMAPREAVGPASMTRMIAYGDELNLAHPPRPKDAKQAWEPEWAARIRLKSVATLMPGMGGMAMSGAAPGQEAAKAPAEAAAPEVKKTLIEGAATELFKGLFNRK